MLRRKNPSTGSGRSLALVGSVLMFAAGAVIVALAVFGPGRSSARKLPDTSFAVATSTPTQTPVPEATLLPTPPPSSAPVARLQIPRIGVDAPVIVLIPGRFREQEEAFVVPLVIVVQVQSAERPLGVNLPVVRNGDYLRFH